MSEAGDGHWLAGDECREAPVARIRPLGDQPGARRRRQRATDSATQASGSRKHARRTGSPNPSGTASESPSYSPSAFPAAVRDAIIKAETSLNEALDRWQPLRDPEPNNANFVHPETGTEYNHRAAETNRILTDLSGGVLTRYPLRPEAPPIQETLSTVLVDME